MKKVGGERPASGWSNGAILHDLAEVERRFATPTEPVVFPVGSRWRPRGTVDTCVYRIEQLIFQGPGSSAGGFAVMASEMGAPEVRQYLSSLEQNWVSVDVDSVLSKPEPAPAPPPPTAPSFEPNPNVRPYEGELDAGMPPDVERAVRYLLGSGYPATEEQLRSARRALAMKWPKADTRLFDAEAAMRRRENTYTFAQKSDLGCYRGNPAMPAPRSEFLQPNKRAPKARWSGGRRWDR